MDFNPELLLSFLTKDLNSNLDISELNQFRSDVLKSTLLKKYVPKQKTAGYHAAALSEFARLNEEISHFRIESSFLESDLFHFWRAELYDAFHNEAYQTTPLTVTNCLTAAKCGPGASVGAKDTSFYTKMFNSELTATRSCLYRMYESTISTRWQKAEAIRADRHSYSIVRGSRLSSVAKDSTKNRTICIEPTLNMFYQLGAKRIIENILSSRYKLNVDEQQDVNKDLARQASFDGSMSTLDLKNASDSISLELAYKLLPSDVMGVLMKIRSPETEINGEYVKLNMLSTMGNGFTFPLMTLLFCSLVKVVYKLAGLTAANAENFGVFGDDIIIVTEQTDAVVQALQLSGFTINLDKSFTTGLFRESCGGDYYSGHDVRGIYIKKVDNETDVYSAFNRLHRWSIRHGIPLINTLLYLKGLVSFKPIPPDEGVSGGFIITSEFLTSPKRDPNGAIFYSKIERLVERGQRNDWTNPHGALICFLGGYVRNNKNLIRSSRIQFRVVRSRTPRWDYVPDAELSARALAESWRTLLSVR